MNISRFLKEEMIVLDFQVEQETPPEDPLSHRWKERNKERILADLVNILDLSGRTGNNCKLLTDFINRERKASTAIGHGIAVPHIRSMQAKEFIMAFARVNGGYEFDAPDGLPVQLFFVMAAPPYDDSFYLKVFQSLATALRYESFRQELITASEPYDIIRAFKNIE
ncbi:MAG: PTS sugar transporter subunit IIA [candidate division Zixibacteria bacterium]|nr:PTS sugar transporter subunit IIA [candidate division Zixibacteria bacterium]